jgi:rare lipoprotein A
MSARSISRGLRAACLVAAAALLTACVSAPRLPPLRATESPAAGTMKPYEIGGHWYYPAEQPHYNEVGFASWYGYGDGYGCRVTADGEMMDAAALTAAHKTLPLPSIVEVTNLETGRKIRVRVNDRGPFVAGRIIDLSRAAAEKLGIFGKGTAKVRVRYVGPAGPKDAEASFRPILFGRGECR